MNNTPITDALAAKDFIPDGIWIAHSRVLERENAELRSTLQHMLTCTQHNDQMRAACPVCLVATLTAERDQLRARAEKAEAELAKYLLACPASPTEEERKRCQQWWSISGRSP